MTPTRGRRHRTCDGAPSGSGPLADAPFSTPPDPLSPVECRPAAILGADVFGDGAAMGEDDEGTGRTRCGHRTVFDDMLRTYLGRGFNTAGAAIRTAPTPKHAPNGIVPSLRVPRTLSGKQLDVRIKRRRLGESIDRIVNRDALANPDGLA